MNFIEHFLDETLGSGSLTNEICMEQVGDYLRVQSSEHPVHIYRVTDATDPIHPAIARIEHNGRTYALAWIEDEKW